MTRLQFLLQDLTDIQVAQIADVQNVNSPKNWRGGKTPSVEILIRFSNHFGESIQQLLESDRTKWIQSKKK